MNKKLFAACAVLAVVAMAAGFAVNINGNVINAFTGFQVGAAAPSGHVLCGNGTNYIDCSAAPTATALATTPVQCGGGTPIATGIAANGDANCTSASGGVPSRVCVASGCSRTYSDGTIEQWGTLFCGTVSCNITFPTAFTTTTNLSLQVTMDYATQGNLVTVTSAISTTGATATSGAVVYNGGGGSGYTGGGTYHWYAIGS